MSEEIQRKLESELSSFKAVQKEYQKAISTRQQLDGQLNENQIVIDELNLLKNEAQVYKSIGPILIKTDLVEAKQNVTKRMDYISKEIKRIDDQLQTLEKKQDTHREALQKIQQQYHQAQVKAAIKS